MSNKDPNKAQKAQNVISPTRAEDFAGWYQEVVKQAEIDEMAHVRGCMVIRPWGYAIWTRLRDKLAYEIESRGHENIYFPLFIPLSYLQKEADHVEGFAKEMAVVTHHRLEQKDGVLVPAAPLEEPVVVRPTSEAIIGESMAKWIQSHRDLPMMLNQWANVVRWELRPRILLRTTEFLWQEGHTAHTTEEEAMAETLNIHDMYRFVAEDWLAIPVIQGEKSPTERFPGAVKTFSIEAMMQDGKGRAGWNIAFPWPEFLQVGQHSLPGRKERAAVCVHHILGSLHSPSRRTCVEPRGRRWSLCAATNGPSSDSHHPHRAR